MGSYFVPADREPQNIVSGLPCSPQKKNTDLGKYNRLQALAWHFTPKNVIAGGEQREYGEAQVFIEQHKGAAVHVDRLFSGLGSELEVWMSHGESNSEQYVILVLANKSRRQALKSSSQVFNYRNDEKCPLCWNSTRKKAHFRYTIPPRGHSHIKRNGNSIGRWMSS